MARFFADENLPRGLVQELRNAGHNVAYGSDPYAGPEDEARPHWAWGDGWIILTEDVDFIDLSVIRQLPVHGLMIVRLFGMLSDAKIARMAAAVAEIGDTGAGEIIIVEPAGNRRRKIADAIAARKARRRDNQP